MNKRYPNILLFASATIGSIFSFFFLISIPIYSKTFIADFGTLINNGLFFISLFLVIFSFFYKNTFKIYIGSLCIILGLLYLLLMISYELENYYYLIPFGLYLITGFLIFYKKI